MTESKDTEAVHTDQVGDVELGNAAVLLEVTEAAGRRSLKLAKNGHVGSCGV